MLSKNEFVSRQQFVQAIRDFKTQYKGKLKDLLNEDRNPDVYQAFWNNPIMRNYLSRDAMNITFDTSNRPILTDSSTKEGHDKTDHYELKIYERLANEVLFRSKKMMEQKESEENFYNQGLRTRQFFIGHHQAVPTLIYQA